MKKNLFILKLLTASLTLSIASLASAELRQWTDSSGRTVEAEYVRYEKGSVVIKLANGQEIPFPMSRLSAADQAFVKELDPAASQKSVAVYAQEIDALVAKKLEEAKVDIRSEVSRVANDETMSVADRKKKIDDLVYIEAMTTANPRTTDEQFVRRIYLDIAGRIPTYNEAVEFIESNDRDKRANLISELLDSEMYVSHMFNWYSDLLRIRSGVNMAANYLKGDPYADWVKDSIREGKPYDQLVREMLTAEGKIWDNPAAGYLLTDIGMPLDNLSNTFTVFMGTEITCAQCHDHPFEEVFQMDFYKMAAFFGETATRNDDREEMALVRQEEQRLQKALKAAGKLPGNREFDNQLRNILNSVRYEVTNTDRNTVKLPHDYKYDDAEPNQAVEPATYFGAIVDVEKYETPRQAFADWMTSPENPRFTVNIVNRLWKHVFGIAQIEPVYNIPGHLDGQAQNYELLKYIEDMMKELDYDVKSFLEVLYNTQAYQREACHVSPTLEQMDRGEYHFPAPVLRRMSAEQIWDSLVTLATPNPDAVQRRGWEEYKRIMTTDLSKLDANGAIQLKEDWQRIGSYGNMEMGMEPDENMMQETRVGGEQMIRASEMPLPARSDHFLRMFGQSDKLLIENDYTSGSVPQVMALLNGRITNSVLTAKDSYLMEVADEASRGDLVDRIFMSILTRYPTGDEKSAARSASRPNKDGTPGYADVIWALVNTREFMFIQ